MAFLKIDKALGDYYAALGRSNYYDANKKGKFVNFCVENGFEEDDIDEEFQNNPSDCMYVEFDEEFPLQPAIDDPDARQCEIVRIIKYCFDHGKAPLPTEPQTANETTEVKESDAPMPKSISDLILQTNKTIRKECDKLYREQCPLLYKDEDVLRRCFAICLQNNGYPFLIHLVDSYLRDKAMYQYEHNKALPMVKWRTKSRYFQKITKEAKSMADTLISGVETYLIRGCTAWVYGPARLVRIQDSMSDIANYILVFSKLVAQLTRETDSTVPFQMDCAIAVGKVRGLNLISNDEDLSDDSEGDSDEDEEKEFNEDLIGDIKEKLTANKLTFYSFEMKHNLNDTAPVLRAIHTAFKSFRNQLSSRKYINYPQKRRFCMFVDRRLRNESNVKYDQITAFEPPMSCNHMPMSHVPEWYFNASKTCIIPGLKSSMNSKGTIRADSPLNGQLVTISFQVEAHNMIKVYMYWMGRYTRIYPQDLSNIFADIFDANCCDNKQWDKQQDAILKQMQFRDPQFEAFYHQVSYKPRQNEVFPKQFK
eukprot:52844_1